MSEPQNSTPQEAKPTPEYAYPWQRTRPYALYYLAIWVIHLLVRVLYRYKVTGKENVPKSAKGIIVVGNHMHAVDPAFLISAVPRVWRFMGKKELFKGWFWGRFYTWCNAFPIDRDGIDRRSLDFALRVMNEGKGGLGIFPEGQRSADGAPAAAKNGVAMIARQTKADILPCAIYYEGKLKFRTRVLVRIGKRIPFAELGLGDAPNKKQTVAASEKIMAAVTELWQKGEASQ